MLTTMQISLHVTDLSIDLFLVSLIALSLLRIY
jgi:hypothetical protein